MYKWKLVNKLYQSVTYGLYKTFYSEILNLEGEYHNIALTQISIQNINLFEYKPSQKCKTTPKCLQIISGFCIILSETLITNCFQDTNNRRGKLKG